MSEPQSPSDIILFHYRGSPYAQRVVYYLTLRNIPYRSCTQPPILPRPDLAALNVSYRRIPILSIGPDIYVDTRLIIETLEKLVPASASRPALSHPLSAPLAPLLSNFVVDGGVFTRSVQLIPAAAPIWTDQGFLSDRTDFMGRPFTKEAVDRVRPEAVAHVRKVWDVYETLLADGRGWIAGTEQVSLADLEGAWPLVWQRELGGLDPALFGDEVYPRTNAWVRRFETAVKEKTAGGPEVQTVSGEQAFDTITAAVGKGPETAVDDKDPLGLRAGQEVSVYPIDTGSNHKDVGKLVGLNKDEVVIAVTTRKDPGKEIRIHAPRWGFRVVPAEQQRANI